MPRGGKRPGAGRKKGSATKRTRKVADRISSDGGVTPLDVMLEAMRSHYDEGHLDDAAKIAVCAAPYVHPRLSTVKVGGDKDNPVPVQFIEVGCAIPDCGEDAA